MSTILDVNNLHVSFANQENIFDAVKGVSFTLNKGETIGIVGESGSGKSVTARSIMRLLPSPPSFVKEGSITFLNEELLDKSEKEMEKIRGRNIGMIFQDPMSSLNPSIKIGVQIAEGIRKHQNKTKLEAHQDTLELLELVGIKNAEERFNQYAHEFSGGMRQRVMIAMALACNPELLIADEPTTALDVTIQAQILKLMKNIQQRFDTSIILITHDLGVVAGMCDKVIVMKDGEIVEANSTESLFANPQHAYTKKLLNALPKLHDKKVEKAKSLIQLSTEPLVEVRSLKQHFSVGKGITLKAVDNISFSIHAGETLGLVGESGSGKTTTGRSILQLNKPTSGDVLYKGMAINRLSKKKLKQLRKEVQIIFQDPYSSLNPRMRIIDIIGRPLDLHNLVNTKEQRTARVVELLELVGLTPEHAMRYPHEFSGGQRQRIGIARALAVNPEFIICDEPLSALDVSIQAQIVKLLKELQQKLGLTYLFIAHDLSMIKHICDRVAVMNSGKIIELAESEELYTNPLHPYTKNLLAAVPIPDPEIESKKLSSPQQKEQPSYFLSSADLLEVSKHHFVLPWQENM